MASTRHGQLGLIAHRRISDTGASSSSSKTPSKYYRPQISSVTSINGDQDLQAPGDSFVEDTHCGFPSRSKHLNPCSEPLPAPKKWKAPCTHTELTFHQLSPYIGKLKSIIAHDLIAEYSREGDLVADVFCGSGTIPLECAAMNRRVFAYDPSEYAITLTKGKLLAPTDESDASMTLQTILGRAKKCDVDICSIPQWVRDFYHPATLQEMLQIAYILRETREHFLFACLLGISHHQRPGFLSYPSSHLVPYLRSRKYPRHEFPEMYEYRRVEPRITAKVRRAYRRYHKIDKRSIVGIRRSTVQNLTPPDTIDCFITSPPYMNALDYGRDNRLRNWILTGRGDTNVDAKLRGEHGFRSIMTSYTRLILETLSTGGHAVFVVGDKVTRTGMKSPSETILDIMQESAPNMVLKETIVDDIPDIRRARRHASGVKREKILVYRRTK